MRYFNTLTKATIDTEFKISGGDWVLEDELKKVVADIVVDTDNKTVLQICEDLIQKLLEMDENHV